MAAVALFSLCVSRWPTSSLVQPLPHAHKPFIAFPFRRTQRVENVVCSVCSGTCSSWCSLAALLAVSLILWMSRSPALTEIEGDFLCYHAYLNVCAHACLSLGGSLRSSGGQYWAGSREAESCLAAAAVPGLKQLTNTGLPLLSLPPPPSPSPVSSLSRFHFLSFYPLFFYPLFFSPLLLSLFSFPPPEALLCSVQEQETESGSVGQLRLAALRV